MEKTCFFLSPPLSRTAKKMILLMKFTAFFILAVSLQVSAKTYSQETLSVDFKRTVLSDALKEVEQKTAYRFVFSNLVLSDRMKVTIAAKDITVADATSLGPHVPGNRQQTGGHQKRCRQRCTDYR
jgi:TonB-dependent starch-binding outer membrane protein SusC